MKQLFLCLTMVCVCSISSAQINCPPNLPLTLSGNTQYCVGTVGSQLTIEETYDEYEWLPTNETSQSVTLSAGNYELVITHYTGCTDTLEFEVEQVSNPPQPVITASGPTEFCSGESVTLSGPSGYPYYEWSTGSVSEQITLYENITVVLSVEDWIGCESSSNSIDVIVNPLPEAIVSPDVNGYEVEFNNLSVNASDYEWNFGDGMNSTDFEPQHTYSLDGEVEMYLVASNDCGADTAFLNLKSVAVEEQMGYYGLSIFPNPSAGLVHFEFAHPIDQMTSISLRSINGKVVMKKNLKPNQARMLLDLSSISDGLYFAEILSTNFSETRRIIINRN